MESRRLLLVSLALAGALVAQRTFTSPPDIDGLEAFAPAVTTLQPFHAANARFQYIDGSQKGAPRAGIAKIELRRDGDLVTGVYPARKTNLVVLLAHSSLANASTLFASNYAGAATTVVTRKLFNLPELSARGTSPAPWSIAIPFDSGVSFSYSGAQDLLVEFQCDGKTPADASYPLDTWDSTAPGQGAVAFVDPLGACTALTAPFLIAAKEPFTDAGGRTKLALYAIRAPLSAAGVLALGLADPNLGNVLCAPLRTSAEITIPVLANALGEIGAPATPIALEFAFPGVVTVFAQFAALDAGQAPRPPVALSDAVKMRAVAAATSASCNRISATSATVPPASLAGGLRSPLRALVLRFTYP